MARATVKLPSLLWGMTGGRAEEEIDAATLDGALAELVRLHPSLRVQLFDESGRLREHVFCFHNGRNTRWSGGLAAALADGDEIAIVQAVSGG